MSTEDFRAVENLAFTGDKVGGDAKYSIALECKDTASAEKVKEGLEVQ